MRIHDTNLTPEGTASDRISLAQPQIPEFKISKAKYSNILAKNDYTKISHSWSKPHVFNPNVDRKTGN